MQDGTHMCNRGNIILIFIGNLINYESAIKHVVLGHTVIFLKEAAYKFQ